MTEAQQAPQTDSRVLDYGVFRPPRKSRAKRWLAVGGAGFLLLVVICGGGFAWLIVGGRAEVRPIVDDFFARIDKQDYVGAYNNVLGPEWRSIDTLESFTRLEERMREIMGPPQSRSSAGYLFGKPCRRNDQV